MTIEQDIKDLSQQIEALREEVRDNVVTFCGHPAMRITFERGDTMVIKITNGPVTDVIAQRIKEYAQKCIPEGVKVMVIGPDVDLIKLGVR
jgi:hypothetical protein